ncbi:MAG TPA: hypothetical protein PK957_00285 [Candidatus Dojkabacteria bacterium]|nr:hypothetical protein [Candidatus Dojkabacteria bacterium]HQF36640.1 hypothetical protein [Candidatus Dojkabacteria bacterium]
MATTMLRITQSDYEKLKSECNANTIVKHEEVTCTLGDVVVEKEKAGVNLSFEMAFLTVYTDYVHNWR